MNVHRTHPPIIKIIEKKDTSNNIIINTSIEKKELKVKVKKKKNSRKQKRCALDICKKKLLLVDLQCKCGKKFCMKHFNAEKHDCIFDYRAYAKKNLEKNLVESIGRDKIMDRI